MLRSGAGGGKIIWDLEPVYNSLKCQYMAVAGAGAGAEIMVKVGAGAENKWFRLCNTAGNNHSILAR